MPRDDEVTRIKQVNATSATRRDSLWDRDVFVNEGYPWTAEENDAVEAAFVNVPHGQGLHVATSLSQRLGRSVDAIETRLHQIRHGKAPDPRIWTAEQLEKLGSSPARKRELSEIATPRGSLQQYMMTPEQMAVALIKAATVVLINAASSPKTPPAYRTAVETFADVIAKLRAEDV